MGLSEKSCEPCRGGVLPLTEEEAQRRMPELSSHWELAEGGHKLEANFNFKNFIEAQSFCLAIGGLAEQEQHHPELHYGWGYCRIELWTHKIDGLHENDFILASKIDGLLPQ